MNLFLLTSFKHYYEKCIILFCQYYVMLKFLCNILKNFFNDLFLIKDSEDMLDLSLKIVIIDKQSVTIFIIINLNLSNELELFLSVLCQIDCCK